MVMTYSRAKVQGQRSVGFEDRVETNGRIDRRTDGQTDGRTDGGDCINSNANAVHKNRLIFDGVIQKIKKVDIVSETHCSVTQSC